MCGLQPRRRRQVAERVAEAEQASAQCAKFFEILEPPDASLPGMGVLSFEHLKTYP